MATYTITISDSTNRTKALIQMILEYAKIDNQYIKVEDTPNETTIKAMMDAEHGKGTRTKSKKDFFEKLNS